MYAGEEELSKQRGLSRYIKRKRLEPLETYVPAVMAAQSQLALAGLAMSESSAKSGLVACISSGQGTLYLCVFLAENKFL